MMHRWCVDSLGVVMLSALINMPPLVREVAQYGWMMFAVPEVKATSHSALIMDLNLTTVTIVKMLLLNAQVRKLNVYDVRRKKGTIYGS